MEENNMQNILVNLYNRCQAIRLRNYLNPKLEAFDLLLCFRSVCKQLDSILNDLTYYLPFDSSVFIDYSKWYNCFSEIETLDIRDFSCIVTTESKHIVDFLFPGSMIDSNRESAEEIRRAIEILTSDIYMKGENLVNSLFYAKMELLNRLLTLDKELKKRKSPEFRIKMINNLFYHYTSYDGNGNIIGKFVDDFEDWKDKCLDLDNDMLETYLWTMVYNLLKKKFLIIDKDNYVKNKANAFFEETKFDLVDGDEFDEDDLKKKYYVLRNLLDYENGRLSTKRLKEEFIKREASNIWDYIWKRFDDIDEKTTVAELVYRIKNKIEIVPKCPVCNRRMPFKSDYSATFCSKKCKMSTKGIDIWQDKFNETMLDRYGTTIAFHNEELLEKMKQTTFDHYGVRCIFESDECKEQRDETMMEKYGCTVPYNIEEVREKMRQTNLERYGTEYPSQNEEIKKKIADTRYERYFSGTEEANVAKAEMV